MCRQETERSAAVSGTNKSFSQIQEHPPKVYMSFYVSAVFFGSTFLSTQCLHSYAQSQPYMWWSKRNLRSARAKNVQSVAYTKSDTYTFGGCSC